MSKLMDIIIPKQQPESISVTCSCLKCDSITCFAKRHLRRPCSCENCNKSKICRYYIDQNEIRKRHSDEITAVYLNAAKRKRNNEFEELTEHDINYESERQRILETNQPPPHSLNEYLDRLLSVTKVSSKYKNKPSSLSGYIDMISENSEYKKKMNLLKVYVQSLKEAKPSNYSEDLENYETFTNAMPNTKLYRYQQLTEKRRGKCKSKCKGKCKHKQTSKNLDITQAQSAMITCPQITHSPGTKSQTNNVPYESSNCPVTCKTNGLPVSEENGFFKYDILKRLKEAYKVCSCKVCECIPTKLTNDDVCNCKPCECAECTNSTVLQTTSSAYNNCDFCRIGNNPTKLQSTKEQKECFCESCECAQCVKNNLDVPCDQCKRLTAYQQKETISNRYITCTCLPCDCIECEHRNGAGRVFSEEQLYNFNHPTTSINEIYHHENTAKKNNPQDIVTMYAGIPSLNTNVGFKNTYSKSCICKECECLKCVCKEDTINSIKSSRFFSFDKHNENKNSIIEKSAIFTKPNYTHSYTPNPWKNKRECIHLYNSDHAPCCACDACIRLEKEMPLYYCKCGSCRCERCYGHALFSNYSKIAGACFIKKGDVLTASAHQTKVQKQILKNSTASEDREYKSLCVNLNSNGKPQPDDIDGHSTSLGLQQASIIRHVKKDTGTMCTKSLDRWNKLQCDAYVNSQTWNISKPLLKNNFTDIRPGSYTSIYSISINKSPSIENERSQSGRENQNGSDHGPDNFVKSPKPIKENFECNSKIDLKLNTHGSIPVLTKILPVQNDFDNILTEASSAHAKVYETRLGFESTNSNSCIEVPKIDLQQNTHRSIPVLPKILSVQNDFNNILTEASSVHAKDCETPLGFEPTNSKSCIQSTESDESRKNKMSDCNLKNKYNIHLNSNNEMKIVIQKKDTCKSLNIELPNVLQTKSLSDPALTSHERVKNNNSEEIPKDRSSKLSNNSGDNYNCYHTIENCTKYNPNGYVYTHKKLTKENLPDYTPNTLLDIDDNYRGVRKTLADAKNFSLHLISVLKMYEKANKEFEKVSDKLKISYEAVFGDKIALNQENCDNKLEKNSDILHNSTNLYLNETKIPDYRQTLFENIIIKRSDDCRRISQKQELTNLNKIISNQDSSHEEYGILEKVSVVNKRQNVFDNYKNFGRACCDSELNKQINEIEKSNYITNPNYQGTLPTHEDETMAEIRTQQTITQATDSKPVENIELRSSKTTSVDNPEKDTHKTLMNKEVEVKMLTVSMNSFGCTAKPSSMDKGEGVNEFPSLEVPVRDTMDARKNSTYTIKSEISYHENKALNQLHSEVKKLLELTLLEPLNFIEDTADSLKELSKIITPQSSVKVDQEPVKQIVNQAEDVNKEISCDGRNFMDEFKKQIREELQVACAHPLFHKGSNLGSYSSNGECDDLKARFLVVHKISEHTALLRWSEPRELMGVKGYELLVDGRTIQKILNPSKCITAVTCLPHTDKILLTIRTITSVLPDAGHYPSTTIIYRPSLQ